MSKLQKNATTPTKRSWLKQTNQVAIQVEAMTVPPKVGLDPKDSILMFRMEN